MRNIFDSHAHYNSRQFDSDREQLLGWTLQEKGVVGIVNMGSDLESCGMLISAVHTEKGEEALHLLMVDDSIPAGAKLC